MIPSMESCDLGIKRAKTHLQSDRGKSRVVMTVSILTQMAYYILLLINLLRYELLGGWFGLLLFCEK